MKITTFTTPPQKLYDTAAEALRHRRRSFGALVYVRSVSLQGTSHDMGDYSVVSISTRINKFSDLPGHTAAFSSMYAITIRSLVP